MIQSDLISTIWSTEESDSHLHL